MRLYAFEGLRYGAPAGDPGPLAAPPYDQINDAARERFHAQSPHQFVHLSRPVAGQGRDMYRRAADLHGRWTAEGLVTRDPRPALYPYVIELADGGRRLGVVGLAGIDDATVIRPHEQTIDKPLADRLALIRAMRVDLEPALFLSEDGGALDRLVAEDVEGAVPLVDHVDADGHHHLLFRIDDPQRIAAYRRAVDGPAAIADGHHRYKVAQRFAGETGAPAGTAASAKLAVVTSLDSPALTIDPIHRGLKDPVHLPRIAAFARSRTPWIGAGGADFAAAVAAAPQPALGIRVAGQDPEIWELDPAHAPASLAHGARALPVLLLHEMVLPALGLGPATATDGTVAYRAQPDELWDQVEAGELGTGFWLPPMQPSAFAAAIAKGDLLPPKSTRFLPKVMSGLVWADHESRVL